MKRIIALAGALFLMAGAASAQTTGEIAAGNCSNMGKVSQNTLNYVNQKKGKLGEATVTNALKDCITACDAAENYMRRDSHLKDEAAGLCIQACNALAKSCDRFPNDKQMTKCANEARKTASNVQKVADAK